MGAGTEERGGCGALRREGRCEYSHGVTVRCHCLKKDIKEVEEGSRDTVGGRISKGFLEEKTWVPINEPG